MPHCLIAQSPYRLTSYGLFFIPNSASVEVRRMYLYDYYPECHLGAAFPFPKEYRTLTEGVFEFEQEE